MKTQKTKWDALSMQDKASLMKIYIENGIKNLEEIQSHYNKFDKGGDTKNQLNFIPKMLLRGANALLSSDKISEDNKKRLIELAMRLSGGNPSNSSIENISKYLLSSEGRTTLKRVLNENTPVHDIVAEALTASTNEELDNYGGLAFNNDFVDMDVESFYADHPGDKDFVSSYIEGVAPFESAGVYKINDSDSTRLGRYKNYLDKSYNGKYIPVYQGYKDTLNNELVSKLNKASYNKETNTYGVHSDNDLQFEFGDSNDLNQGHYDAAGYNLELIKGDDGIIYGRKSDVYDFFPKDFMKTWIKETSKPVETFLKNMDNIGNPFIFRSPWFIVHKDKYNIPEEVLEKFESENKR